MESKIPPRGTAVLDQVPEMRMDLVRKAHVMVVGAGAVGNEVLKNLGLLGVGHIYIVDMDQVEYGNLYKSVLFTHAHAAGNVNKAVAAAESLRQMCPEVEVVALQANIVTGVGLGLMRKMDVVIGCVDNRLARLWINRYCGMLGLPWVNAGIGVMGGEVEVFHADHNCYECAMSEEAWEDINRQYPCAHVVAAQLRQGIMPTTPLSASFAATLQTVLAIKLVQGVALEEVCAQVLQFDFKKAFPEVSVWGAGSRRVDVCGSHGGLRGIVESSSITTETRLGDLFVHLKSVHGMLKPSLELTHPLVTRVRGGESSVALATMVLKPNLFGFAGDHYRTIAGETLEILEETDVLDECFAHQHLSLEQLCIPASQLLRIWDAGKLTVLELGKHKPEQIV